MDTTRTAPLALTHQLRALLAFFAGFDRHDDGTGLIGGLFMSRAEARTAATAIRPHLAAGDLPAARRAAADALTPGWEDFRQPAARQTALDDGARFADAFAARAAEFAAA